MRFGDSGASSTALTLSCGDERAAGHRRLERDALLVDAGDLGGDDVAAAEVQRPAFLGPLRSSGVSARAWANRRAKAPGALRWVGLRLDGLLRRPGRRRLPDRRSCPETPGRSGLAVALPDGLPGQAARVGPLAAVDQPAGQADALHLEPGRRRAILSSDGSWRRTTRDRRPAIGSRTGLLDPGHRQRQGAVLHLGQLAAEPRAVLVDGADHPGCFLLGERQEHAGDLVLGDPRLALLGLEDQFLRGGLVAGRAGRRRSSRRRGGCGPGRCEPRGGSRRSTGRSAATRAARRRGCWPGRRPGSTAGLVPATFRSASCLPPGEKTRIRPFSWSR